MDSKSRAQRPRQRSNRFEAHSLLPGKKQSSVSSPRKRRASHPMRAHQVAYLRSTGLSFLFSWFAGSDQDIGILPPPFFDGILGAFSFVGSERGLGRVGSLRIIFST